MTDPTRFPPNQIFTGDEVEALLSNLHNQVIAAIAAANLSTSQLAIISAHLRAHQGQRPTTVEAP